MSEQPAYYYEVFRKLETILNHISHIFDDDNVPHQEKQELSDKFDHILDHIETNFRKQNKGERE